MENFLIEIKHQLKSIAWEESLRSQIVLAPIIEMIDEFLREHIACVWDTADLSNVSESEVLSALDAADQAFLDYINATKGNK